MVASAKTIALAPGDGGIAHCGVARSEFVATKPGSSTLEGGTW
jgi:hypothetical protein